MKKFIMYFLVFVSGNALSDNTVLAIVNNIPISLNTIQSEFFSANSYKKKLEILNSRIDVILQLEKVNELDLWSTEENIDKFLLNIAQNNNISIDELSNFDDLDLIKNEISEKLSILSLQRFITHNIPYPKEKISSKCSNINLIKDQKQIKVAQIIISEIYSDSQTPEQKNASIKSFLKKLSNHISKGASFEAFAKLHSQHPSYKDGGVSDWLTVNNTTLEMLDSLEISEISEIYSTDFGLAIAIKIDERFISSKLKACEERVIYQNAEKYYAKWLKDLREQSFIEIYYEKLN